MATSEVLRLLSGSHGDLNHLFDTILANATNLCQSNFGTLSLCEGDAFRIVAMHNVPSGLAELRRREPLVRAGPLLRMAETKRLLHIADYTEYVASHPADGDAAAFAKLTGVRTALEVPMLKDDDVVGAIVIYRKEVRRFDDREIALIKDFAAQAVIAIENARLLNELRQRTTDLTERTADLTEALEQQTATSEVLQVISSFAGELDTVFQAILANATHICEAKHGTLFLFADGAFQPVAAHGASAALAFERLSVEPAPGTGLGRMVSAKAAIQIADVLTDENFPRDHPLRSAAERRGVRTLLCVPMIKEGELIGAISIFRQEVRPFTDRQIELVKNFAAQAVIAIENARLLNELRSALVRQTATSEVLQVISRSPGDLEPVFAAMLKNVTTICCATFANLLLYDGRDFHVTAMHNASSEYAHHRQLGSIVNASPKNPLRRIAATKRLQHMPDIRNEDVYIEGEPAFTQLVEKAGARTLLNVPLLKEGDLVGVIGIYRQEVRPFADEQIELVQNFAAQAVIAIENARLLNELRQRTADLTERTTDLTEALERQTATSEVLQVISGSPGELQPVFATMLENMVRVCHASFGAVHRCHGDVFQFVAERNSPPAYANLIRHSPFRPGPHHYFGPMIASKSVEQFADLTASQGYLDQRPEFVTAVELGGVRTGLNVPMLKKNELIGAFALARKEVRPFTEKQIELVKNFAAQAVIAIENARLLNELRQRTTDLTERTADLTEALEQQTATSEVLQVISSSPGDLEPVFASMLENAVRICDAKFGNIYRWDGEALHIVATHNTPPAFAEDRRGSPYRHDPKSPIGPIGHMVATKTLVHIRDVAAEETYINQRDPVAVKAVALGGIRTLLGVPLLNKDEMIGAFFLSRQEVRPFTEKQIGLVKNFAAQAVVAIENTRLLNELRERTEEVEKLNQHLEKRVTDQVGEIERMSRLRRFLPPQVADLIVASGSEKQLESHRREITALFCDLRGFTGFSESADPEDVMTLLREYHEAIGDSIIKYSGTLERYAGDGVMVVFNDPVPVENPALQAVLMALEMRDAIGALTETWRRWGHEIGFGIGIAHGFATLGTIGFEGRFDYAAIGTVSNVASRLCDEAKPGQILISPRVLTKVENAVKVEPVGEFELKGIRRPLAAYNVIAAAS